MIQEKIFNTMRRKGEGSKEGRNGEETEASQPGTSLPDTPVREMFLLSKVQLSRG